MTSAPIDPLIGRTLDERYVIRSRIARGGMAMVYLAHDLRLEREVAVKVMHAHLAEDENFTRRFEQEARSAAKLSHPNLVNVFDQGRDNGHSYLVMEYLPSITLRELLKQQTLLTPAQTLDIAGAILSGLAAAHTAGIVHRDLKPENVLLADDGRIKLGDFGLARAVSANTTTGQALLGTIAYLSPELVTRGIADARSDIYAFGILLYEMLTGEQPFTGEQPMQIAYQHAHSEVPAPSQREAGISEELDELVLWMTSRDPEQRPRDAAEVLEFVEALRKETPRATRTTVLPTALLPPEATSAFTRVLPDTAHTTHTLGTPDITTRAAPHSDSDVADSALPATVQRATQSARRRMQRGRITAAALVVLVGAAGGVGWWFGQGPGALIVVPDVSETPTDAATRMLTELSFTVRSTDCSSVSVPPDHAVSTTPGPGSRLERGSEITVCNSTGPAMKAVPTLVGLSAKAAEVKIRQAGFRFGKILEKRFGDEDSDTVLAALGSDGNALGESYPEQGVVNLIVSAGDLPQVAGKSLADATAAITRAGLVYDETAGSEAYSDDVPEGDVIMIVTTTDPVRPGDAIGFQTSLGPELFPVPDVSGKSLADAMASLADAGFAPSTLVPDALKDFAQATGTDPAAGTKLPAGAEVRVKSTISL